MVLAMVGLAVMPLTVGNGWAVGGYLLEKSSKNWNAEAGLAWSICGAIIGAHYATAIPEALLALGLVSPIGAVALGVGLGIAIGV